MQDNNENTTTQNSLHEQQNQVENPQYIAQQSAAQSHIIQKRPRRLIMLIGVFLTIFLVIAIAIGIYYFVFRLSDKEYDVSAKEILSAETAIKNDSFNMSSLTGVSASEGTTEVLGIYRSKINAYIENIDKFNASQVMAHDEEMQKVYSTYQAHIENYGISVKDIVDTRDTYNSLGLKWNKYIKEYSETKSMTAASYDQLILDLNSFIKDHPTVPLKDFNDKIYVPLRSITIEAVSSLRVHLATSDKGEITSAHDKMQRDAKLQESYIVMAKGYKYNPPANPSSDLEILEKALHDRRSKFFR